MESISLLLFNNIAAPSLVSSKHQKNQAAILGDDINAITHTAGLTVCPVWAYGKSKVVDATSRVLRIIENNSFSLDGNFSILVEKKKDERDDRPLNHPGRICIGSSKKRSENVRLRTPLFVKGQVMVPELLRTRSMVFLEDTSQDSLPTDTIAHTHTQKPERKVPPARRPRSAACIGIHCPFFAISGCRANRCDLG